MKFLYSLLYLGFFMAIGSSIVSVIVLYINRNAFESDCSALQYDINNAENTKAKLSEEKVTDLNASLDRIKHAKSLREVILIIPLSTSMIGMLIILFSTLVIIRKRRTKQNFL